MAGRKNVRVSSPPPASDAGSDDTSRKVPRTGRLKRTNKRPRPSPPPSPSASASAEPEVPAETRPVVGGKGLPIPCGVTLEASSDIEFSEPAPRPELPAAHPPVGLKSPKTAPRPELEVPVAHPPIGLKSPKGNWPADARPFPPAIPMPMQLVVPPVTVIASGVVKPEKLRQRWTAQCPVDPEDPHGRRLIPKKTSKGDGINVQQRNELFRRLAAAQMHFNELIRPDGPFPDGLVPPEMRDVVFEALKEAAANGETAKVRSVEDIFPGGRLLPLDHKRAAEVLDYLRRLYQANMNGARVKGVPPTLAKSIIVQWAMTEEVRPLARKAARNKDAIPELYEALYRASTTENSIINKHALVHQLIRDLVACFFPVIDHPERGLLLATQNNNIPTPNVPEMQIGVPSAGKFNTCVSRMRSHVLTEEERQKPGRTKRAAAPKAATSGSDSDSLISKFGERKQQSGQKRKRKSGDPNKRPRKRKVVSASSSSSSSSEDDSDNSGKSAVDRRKPKKRKRAPKAKPVDSDSASADASDLTAGHGAISSGDPFSSLF